MLNLMPSFDQHKPLNLPVVSSTVRITGPKALVVSLKNQPPVQFGNKTLLRAAETIAETNMERFATMIDPWVKRIGKVDIGKLGGLGLEDWAARFLTLIGLYIPQGYFSLKNDSHVWETNGRNALMWGLAVAIVSFSKNDKWGFNTVLNRFMQNKNEPSAKGFWDKLFSPLRLDGDYFTVLKKVGIPHKPDDAKRAFWASMDSNMVDRLVYQYNNNAEGKVAKVLDQAEHKLLGQFLKRRNLFSLTSTALITGLTVYLIGKVAMDFVFKFIAPMDHDYEPPLPNQKGKQQPFSQESFPQRPMPSSYPLQTGPALQYAVHPLLQRRAIFAGAFGSELSRPEDQRRLRH